MRLKAGIWVAAALGIAGMAASRAARADNDNGALRKVIEADYARYTAGIKHRDCGPLFRMEAPDYSCVGADGKVTWRWRNDYIARATMKLAVGVPVDTVQINQFKVSHHRVDVQETETTIFQFRDPRTKGLRNLGATSVNWDIWVLTRDGWRVQCQVVQRHSETWDVPIPPPASPPPSAAPGQPASDDGAIDHVA